MAITLDGTNGILSPDFEPSSSTTPTNGLFLPAANTVGLATGSTERLRIDSSGNLGLGVTPSAWEAGTRKAFQLGLGGSVSSDTAANSILLSSNAVNASTGWKYINTDYASNYYQSGGAHVWRTAPSGTAGNAISFTQAMTLDASGNLGIGVSPSYKLDTATGSARVGDLLAGYSGSSILLLRNLGGKNRIDSYNWPITANYPLSILGSFITFDTGDIERARIDSSGNLLVGTTSNPGSYRVEVDTSGNYLGEFRKGGSQVVAFEMSATPTATQSSTNAAMYIVKASTTNRSINAGGTVNANGADYAEYMSKAGDFQIAKGDVCGVDANGLLTNVFSSAVSFVVKSTDPSYVGNDSWGVGFKDDPEGLEIARQKVDRIAFAGQVPVNVFGAKAGDYIIPVADADGIKGEAVSNPTFEQYQIAIGKVIAIESDGRAKIIVKVA